MNDNFEPSIKESIRNPFGVRHEEESIGTGRQTRDQSEFVTLFSIGKEQSEMGKEQSEMGKHQSEMVKEQVFRRPNS